eukprot:2892470-Prymnesium_polylepis.1
MPSPGSQRRDPPKARGPQHTTQSPCTLSPRYWSKSLPRAHASGELTVHYGDAYDRGDYPPTEAVHAPRGRRLSGTCALWRRLVTLIRRVTEARDRIELAAVASVLELELAALATPGSRG